MEYVFKFLGLLVFLVMLDFHANCQNCDPAACKKATTALTQAEAPAAQLTAQVNQQTKASKTVCDPADCPPMCRILCKSKNSITGQVGKSVKVKKDEGATLPKLAMREPAELEPLLTSID